MGHHCEDVLLLTQCALCGGMQVLRAEGGEDQLRVRFTQLLVQTLILQAREGCSV